MQFEGTVYSTSDCKRREACEDREIMRGNCKGNGVEYGVTEHGEHGDRIW